MADFQKVGLFENIIVFLIDRHYRGVNRTIFAFFRSKIRVFRKSLICSDLPDFQTWKNGQKYCQGVKNSEIAKKHPRHPLNNSEKFGGNFFCFGELESCFWDPLFFLLCFSVYFEKVPPKELRSSIISRRLVSRKKIGRVNFQGV